MDWVKHNETCQVHEGKHGSWSVNENPNKQGLLAFKPNESPYYTGYREALFGSVAEARLAVALLDNSSDHPKSIEDQAAEAGYTPVRSEPDLKSFSKSSGRGVMYIMIEGRIGARSIKAGYESTSGHNRSMIAHLVESAHAHNKDGVGHEAEASGFDRILLDFKTVLAIGAARETLRGNARRRLKTGEEDALIDQVLLDNQPSKLTP